MAREIRDIVKIDEELCDGCGLCVPGCEEGAIEIRDGKARLVAEKYCDGLGACLGHCPRGAIKVIKREADSFDMEAVEERLREQETSGQALQEKPEPASRLGCGCPGSAMADFAPDKAHTPAQGTEHIQSALTHWPVQIRLVPPHAPFLKGAHLLIAADCVPVAYPGLHQDLLPGRKIMLGCPKFDDGHDYVERLTEIFRQADIKSVTVASMEVPCCAGMVKIVEKAVVQAGKDMAVEEVVISRQGQVMPQGRPGAEQSRQKHVQVQQGSCACM